MSEENNVGEDQVTDLPGGDGSTGAGNVTGEHLTQDDESTAGAPDPEVVDQSESVGEEAAEVELSADEIEAKRKRDIKKNAAGNEGAKTARKHATNNPDD